MTASPPHGLGRERWGARLRRDGRLLPLWTRREVQVQYRQSALDIGWTLITPVVTLAGYGFVLTRAFGVDGDGIPYITFAWTGVVIWTFIAGSLSRGALSLVHAADLVRKAPFPREVVPIATVLAVGLDLGIGLGVLGVLMLVQGIEVSIHAVAALPVLVVMLVWATACAIIFATLTAFVRDLAHGLGVVLRIGIFVTPVMYPVSQIPDGYRWTLDVNPVSVFIEAIRDALLRNQWPNWELLAVHLAIGLGLLGLGLLYVRRVEGRIADLI